MFKWLISFFRKPEPVPLHSLIWKDNDQKPLNPEAICHTIPERERRKINFQPGPYHVREDPPSHDISLLEGIVIGSMLNNSSNEIERAIDIGSGGEFAGAGASGSWEDSSSSGSDSSSFSSDSSSSGSDSSSFNSSGSD